MIASYLLAFTGIIAVIRLVKRILHPNHAAHVHTPAEYFDTMCFDVARAKWDAQRFHTAPATIIIPRINHTAPLPVITFDQLIGEPHALHRR